MRPSVTDSIDATRRRSRPLAGAAKYGRQRLAIVVGWKWASGQDPGVMVATTGKWSEAVLAGMTACVAVRSGESQM